MIRLKKITFFIVAVLIIACNTKKESHPTYVEISGKIINAKSTEIFIYGAGSKKVIPIKENGLFKDSLKVEKGRNKQQFMLMKDQMMTSVYLENGADVYVEADASNFMKTLHFDLDFADFNNYLNKKAIILSSKNGFNKTWYRENKANFNHKIANLRSELSNALKSYANIPSEIVKNEVLTIEQYIEKIVGDYAEENKFASKLVKGAVSPTFKDYENYDGSKTSLSDFKGKYVYIDVWATWCGPCKAQIPFLKKVEKEYHGKNIVFVSMSVDKEKDYDEWRKMIEEKQLSGVQIIAPNQTNSEFTKAYNIHSIPRFILIDPNGKIVDYDAPRPSDTENIKKIFSII